MVFFFGVLLFLIHMKNSKELISRIYLD